MKTIGAFEYIDIPVLGLEKVKAKIDTGAAISAIHSPFFDTIIRNGVMFVIYKLFNSDGILSTNKFKVVNVTNSFSQTEVRYQVPISIKLNGEYFEADFTLTNREKLESKVLVGKNIISLGNFIVDIHKNTLISESIDASTVVCDNCGHTWQLQPYDKQPHLCHVCCFDNFKGKFIR